MKFRIENKYKIEKTKLNYLYKFLSTNKANILYPKREINSIYFDNSQMKSYYDSLEGTVPRKKIRLRSYPNKISKSSNRNYSFEIKINSPEGKIKVSKKNLNFEKLLKTGFYDFEYGQCYPIVETNYYREYYNLLNFRLTIDKNIKYSKFKKKKYMIPIKDQIIVEVKSNDINASNYIDKNFHFEKIRFSKYCNAIDEIYFS